MLNPNNDRLDYGSILSARENYELDFAIGTTYSLDLDSLVGASIALGLSEETDTILRKNSIFLLEALRAAGNKIALFCENGHIKHSGNLAKLYILLEEMVFQVNNSNIINSKYASFHPKFWLIRYVNKKDVLYRIIVLSRNLTFDRSWDISFAMEGKKVENSSDSIKEKNKNLTIFLRYLKKFSTNQDKTDKINKIIKELNYVEFDLDNNTFYDFDFIPNGIRNNISIANSPLFKDDFDELVIISPFLSKTVINQFNQRAKNNKSYQKSKEDKGERLYLFTRLNSLAGFKHEDCDEFKIYRLKDEIIDGERKISEESETLENSLDLIKSDLDESNDENIENIDLDDSDDDNQVSFKHQDIHAKIYFVKRGSKVDLYLGSLNASCNALKGNVEFMIHLKTNSRKFKLEKLLDDLFCGAKEGDLENPFQRVNMDEIKFVEDEEKEKDDLNYILKNIARLDFKSKITFDGQYYKINLEVKNFSDFEKNHNVEDSDITIHPLLLTKEDSKTFSKNMSFDRLEKLKLSTFFVITIEKKGVGPVSGIIKVETEGMPEDREKDVISSIINDDTAFKIYVAFLLDEDPISSLVGTGTPRKKDEKDGLSKNQVQLPALYEKMLDAAVDNGDKFKEIGYLIQTLSGGKAIPEGFEELYNTFKEVIDNE